MNKTILQQLFDGELYPSETINDPESRKISSIIAEEREYLFERLSDGDRESLRKMNDLYHEVTNIYGNECFACGFRLGALLLIEVFSKNIDDFDQIK
ncbi:MAG: hypothetical protein FWD71_08470 [Oscillospiraceae bacterium]|nr:hypothetical protein [Oscillospiraceae bacterium]